MTSFIIAGGYQYLEIKSPEFLDQNEQGKDAFRLYWHFSDKVVTQNDSAAFPIPLPTLVVVSDLKSA